MIHCTLLKRYTYALVWEQAFTNIATGLNSYHLLGNAVDKLFSEETPTYKETPTQGPDIHHRINIIYVSNLVMLLEHSQRYRPTPWPRPRLGLTYIHFLDPGPYTQLLQPNINARKLNFESAWFYFLCPCNSVQRAKIRTTFSLRVCVGWPGGRWDLNLLTVIICYVAPCLFKFSALIITVYSMQTSF